MQSNPFETSENPFSDPYNPSGGLGESSGVTFHHECDRIKAQIVEYKQNIQDLETLQSKQVHAVSEKEKQRILQQIDSATLNMKTMQSGIKYDIENLKTLVVKSDPDMVHQLNNLNRLFRGALQDLMVKEDSFKETVTNQAIEQYQIVNPESNYQEAKEFVLVHGSEDVFTTSIEMQNKKANAMEVYQNVKYRHDELVKIQEMAATLNQMFNDLQDLVVEQDVYLNSANENVGQAQSQLEKGDANVIQATTLSKKNRKCKWIIVVLIIILLCIIAGIIAGLVKGLK